MKNERIVHGRFALRVKWSREGTLEQFQQSTLMWKKQTQKEIIDGWGGVDSICRNCPRELLAAKLRSFAVFEKSWLVFGRHQPGWPKFLSFAFPLVFERVSKEQFPETQADDKLLEDFLSIAVSFRLFHSLPALFLMLHNNTLMTDTVVNEPQLKWFREQTFPMLDRAVRRLARMNGKKRIIKLIRHGISELRRFDKIFPNDGQHDDRQIELLHWQHFRNLLNPQINLEKATLALRHEANKIISNWPRPVLATKA